MHVIRTVTVISSTLALLAAGSQATADETKTAKVEPKKDTKDSKPDAKPVAKDAKKPPPKAETVVAPKAEVIAAAKDPILGAAAKIDGDEAQNVVAFTFDDGPNPTTTPAVIDALVKYDVPATFFIVTQRIAGKAGEKSREILAKEVSSGFQIGSHSVTHANLKLASAANLVKEIDGSITALSKEIGKPVGIFRAPYGALGPAGRTRLSKIGLTEAFWSIDTLDWQAKNAERLRTKVLTMIVKQNGGVVLMHDVKPITAKIIESVLDDLEAENCARLVNASAKDAKPPIIPVSIHYFLKDGKAARAIPEDVKKRTEAYTKALPTRCSKRPKPPPPAETSKK